MGRAAMPGRNLLVHAIAAALAIPTAASAATISVDGATCSLANAILSANSDTAIGGCAAGSGRDSIQMSTTQSIIGESLPVVTTDVDFVGLGATQVIVSGDSAHRLFMIGDDTHAPAVTFTNLTLAGGVVHGGDASSGGGGGAGLGGAMFVYSGTVSIDLSVFSENGASGGNTSGSVSVHSGGGGGGGLLGVGGTGAGTNEVIGGAGGGGGAFGGGGGGGGNSYNSEGGGGSGGSGGGTFPGSAGVPPQFPTDGGFGGGGGGGGASGSSASQPGANGGFGGGGGGGAGSGTGTNVDVPGSGGNGGFGGGGGAGGSANSAPGAAGGFGGFGGGAGSAGTGSQYGTPGQPGFGGGNSAVGGGGGGGGFGAALFVRSGHVHVTNTLITGNNASRGLGPGGNGLGKGGAIFAVTAVANGNGNDQGMPALPALVTGCGVAFSSNLASDAGTSNGDNADTYGVDRVGLTLACGDRIFADEFGPP